MSSSIAGRVHGATIELDAPLPSLEGQRVRVVVEPMDDPVEEAIRNAPLDDFPLTDEERAAVVEWRAGRTHWIPGAEVRAKIEAGLRDVK